MLFKYEKYDEITPAIGLSEGSVHVLTLNSPFLVESDNRLIKEDFFYLLR